MERAETAALITASLLLMVGAASALYLEQVEEENKRLLTGDTLTVGGQDLVFREVFASCPKETVTTEKGPYTGVFFSCLFNATDLDDPAERRYTLRGADGYEKTLDWHEVQAGIITEDRLCVFPDLARAFWIKVLVEIKVK
jgi:hypothetical protein